MDEKDAGKFPKSDSANVVKKNRQERQKVIPIKHSLNSKAVLT